MKLEINVNVNLGLTEEVSALVGGYLGVSLTELTKAAGLTEKAPTLPKLEEPQKCTEEKTQPPTTQPQEDSVPKLTAEDVREAMHEARAKLIGEDYKDNKTSDNYKKYYKKLNAEFIKIAGLLEDGKKPSELSAESRTAFVEACKSLVIDHVSGAITSKVPF